MRNFILIRIFATLDQLFKSWLQSVDGFFVITKTDNCTNNPPDNKKPTRADYFVQIITV